MISYQNRRICGCCAGFSLVEILIIIVVLLVAAAMSVPMISGAADMQVRSGSSKIAADLEYAKNMAITNQKTYTVTFDTNANSYQLSDSDGVIDHPFENGSFVVNFSTDSRFKRVSIDSADFDSSNSVTYDYLGCPYSGTTVTSPLNLGEVTLSADSVTATVSVEPATGYVTIQ